MKIITAFVCAAMLGAQPLFAQPVTFESGDAQVPLVELFSSEGCSSCPPAEAWVSRLKTDAALWKSFVPVVFHVDYWNGLGWPDRFSSRDFTARQHRYAAAWRSDSVYTPGFVYNGSEWRDWHGSLPAAPAEKTGRLTIALRDRTHADISFTPRGAPPATLQAEVALLGGDIESDVKRGENSGRKLRHDFVVLHLAKAALAEDGAHYTASITLPEKLAAPPNALAAWVTTDDARPPLQATGGWLRNP